MEEHEYVFNSTSGERALSITIEVPSDKAQEYVDDYRQISGIYEVYAEYPIC